MMTVKLWNKDDTKRMFLYLQLFTEKSMANAITMGAFRIVNTMKELAPKDTGEMAESITTQVVQNSKNEIAVRVGPTDDIFYAKYVEYGTGIYAVNGVGRQTPWVYYNQRWGQFVYTVGNKPQPFIYKSLVKNAPKIKEYLALSLTEGYGKVTRK